MFKLWSFAGGVHLDTHRAESTGCSITVAKPPKILIYPLALRDGSNANPLVEPGERVLKGQPITKGQGWMNPPQHAASSGRVLGVEPRPLPHPSGLVGDCLVIETDGEDESIEFHSIADYAELDPQALRSRIHEAGIVGLGGAAFPTAVKVNPGERRAIDTLIINGAECEPYITCDDSLMRHFPHQVLEGAKMLMRVLGVQTCLVGIEEDMPQAIAAMENAQAAGDFVDIQIIPVPAIYPTGGEKQLIQVLTGREVAAGRIPADVGVVCQNVGTAAAVQRAITTGEPLMSRLVTVTGLGIRQPQNLLVRIGTPIADLVGQCGGYTDKAQRLILGGPMMGFTLPSDDFPIVKATNCILVAGADEVLAETKQALPCIRCGECASACPVNLLPQQLYWHSRAGNLERVADYHLADCIECGCCDVVCPSHIPLVQYFRASKSKLAAKDRERQKADHARQRFDARQQRKEQEKLERAESARRKKELLEKAPAIQQAMDQAKADKAREASLGQEQA